MRVGLHHATCAHLRGTNPSAQGGFAGLFPSDSLGGSHPSAHPHKPRGPWDELHPGLQWGGAHSRAVGGLLPVVLKPQVSLGAKELHMKLLRTLISLTGAFEQLKENKIAGLLN